MAKADTVEVSIKIGDETQKAVVDRDVIRNNPNALIEIVTQLAQASATEFALAHNDE